MDDELGEWFNLIRLKLEGKNDEIKRLTLNLNDLQIKHSELNKVYTAVTAKYESLKKKSGVIMETILSMKEGK